jgi:hypothetical protein
MVAIMIGLGVYACECSLAWRESAGKLLSMEWMMNEEVGEMPHIYTTVCGVKLLESKQLVIPQLRVL